MLAKGLFEYETERLKPAFALFRIFQAGQTPSGGWQVEQRRILPLPLQCRFDRLFAKQFESCIVQSESFHGLLGRFILFSCGNLAPHVKDKPCLTIG